MRREKKKHVIDVLKLNAIILCDRQSIDLSKKFVEQNYIKWNVITEQNGHCFMWFGIAYAHNEIV